MLSKKLVQFQKKNFPTESPQTKAFEYADAHGGLPVFGFQQKDRGGYSYLVAENWESFLDMYSKFDAKRRSFYEVIRPHVPVNLYIDAECYRESNPSIQPRSTEETNLCNQCKEAIRKILIDTFLLDPVLISFFELDASDDSKVSKHYIVHIQDYALSNYQIAGDIIRRVVESTPVDSVLWVNDKKHANKKVFFIDTGVYTLNRLFRMYQSTKCNSSRYLHVSDSEIPGGDVISQYFWLSLVTWFEQPYSKLGLLTVEPLKSKILSSLGRGTSRTLNGDYVNRKTVDFTHESNEIKNLATALSGMFQYRTYSPHIAEGSSIFTLSVLSHECVIAQSKHSGNHIYYVFYLDSMTYNQHCYSTRCQGKCGPIIPIPDSYREIIQSFLKSREVIRLADIFAIFKQQTMRC